MEFIYPFNPSNPTNVSLTFHKNFFGTMSGAILFHWKIEPDIWHVCYLNDKQDYQDGYFQQRDHYFTPIGDEYVARADSPLMKAIRQCFTTDTDPSRN